MDGVQWEVLDAVVGEGPHAAELEASAGSAQHTLALQALLLLLIAWASSAALGWWQRHGGIWLPRLGLFRKAGLPPVNISPPPLKTLVELETESAHDNDDDVRTAFRSRVEVINLVTPPSSAGARAGPSGLRGGPEDQPPADRLQPQAVTPSRSSAGPRSLLGLFTAAARLRTPGCGTPAAGRAAAVAPPHSPPVAPGWDPALLAATAAQEATIASLAGLQASKEFQAHVRSKTGNLDRHLEQAEARLGVYRALRQLDREAFTHALTRTDIQVIDSKAPAVLPFLLDHAATCWAWLRVLRWGMAGGGGGPGAAVALWAAVHALAAWLHHRPTLLGAVLGVQVVTNDRSYPEHTMLAPLWRVVAAGLLDGALACTTLGFGAWLTSVALVLRAARRPDGSCPPRQTLGQALLGVHCMREVVTGIAAVPQYAGSVSPTGPGVTHVARTPRPACSSPPLVGPFLSPTGPRLAAEPPSLRPYPRGTAAGTDDSLAPTPSAAAPLHRPGRARATTGLGRATMAAAPPVQSPAPVGMSRGRGWAFGAGRDALPPPSQAHYMQPSVRDSDDALLFSVEHRVWCSPSLRRSNLSAGPPSNHGATPSSQAPAPHWQRR